MSRQVLEAVIGRAILNYEFRCALFADPEAALFEYELTTDEIAALKSLDAESLDSCGQQIGKRVAGDLPTRATEPGAAMPE